MAMVEAKGKVKIRHERAIRKFQEWLAENPNVSSRKKYTMFNILVDKS